MKLFLKNTTRIPLFLIFLLLNTIIHGSLVSLCGIIKFFFPTTEFSALIARIAYWISGGYVLTNNFLITVFYDPEWDMQGQVNLNMKGTYLVMSNHLSLLDIPTLQRLFFQRIPFLRFFIKQQLIFVPFLGQGLWALNFPSMKRYSKETLNKHPELSGKDLETTKRSCDNLRGQPVTMLIYAEGTRFTLEKHHKANSPYKNLLKPRAGGVQKAARHKQGAPLCAARVGRRRGRAAGGRARLCAAHGHGRCGGEAQNLQKHARHCWRQGHWQGD